MLVDAGGDQPVGGLGREQQVIDANAVVLLPGAGLIVPEAVEAASVRGRAHGVRQAEVRQRPKPGARFRQEERVPDTNLRVVHVDLGRNVVVVAREHERLLQLQAFA